MATTGSLKRSDQGVDRSDVKTFTIADAATGSAVAAIDLGRPYAFIVVWCEDAQFIPASTTLGAQVADEADGTLVALYKQNGEAVYASGTLPTSNGFRFLLPHAAFAQKLRFILSNAASGGAVVLKAYGYDGVKIGGTF